MLQQEGNDTSLVKKEDGYHSELVHSNPNVMDAYPDVVPDNNYEVRWVWRNIFLYILLHVSAIKGFYLLLTSSSWPTVFFAILLNHCCCLGITAGAHRLWSHRAYKAKLPLRLLLVTFNTMAFQNHAIEWARDHRVHHKYSETNADPHNAKRGFFFSHVGWLLSRKHPDVIRKGRGVDISDLENDPILKFQKKFYWVLMPFACFIIPTVVPVYLWGETWTNSWYVATLFRYCFSLNMTWLVNSAAHLWGQRPYDKNINPAENLLVSIGALGEGWHNYHHTFPWDYKTAELGNYSSNLTTAFLDLMAKVGWAYDLKTVSEEVVRARVIRTGDGSHHKHGDGVWGWGDKDMSLDDKHVMKIVNGKSMS